MTFFLISVTQFFILYILGKFSLHSLPACICLFVCSDFAYVELSAGADTAVTTLGYSYTV